ncbi:type III secretion system inner membrane ring lipoprotein SctJ [Candidatus Pantoea multigeneris]|uniref:Lipoprotein n=1 Tax=Candidatus Pantoea multigeneris TaxID=2608357 RepID=A0ABX0RGM1_9GAMM|nr:type III secretion inner membrane ring lipoprotein SctJ [Pantoea multigeneris]NIF23283.1 EscJ/YscJ/HrcJ family type III secretion inner membrane ring protein [Pantoea multigeneris]
MIKLMVIFAVVLLTGCDKKIELHRGLSEKEANDVIVLLARNSLFAEKGFEKEGYFISVKSDDLANALKILKEDDYPKKRRATLGDTFKKEGIVSSSMEERIRYVYALSQAMEETLENIDGVILSRVQIVLPERLAPGTSWQPASASVFIKHKHYLDIEGIETRVKKLVANSIPGLSETKYNDVSVVFVSQHDEPIKNGGHVKNKEINNGRMVIYGLMLLWVLLLIGFSIRFYLKKSSKMKVKNEN